MGTPAEFLPQPIAGDSIQALLEIKGLPTAIEIVSPRVTAEYHSIYFITVPPCEETHGHSELVLRVSGRHLPRIKTKNEVAVMSWVAQKTTIPVPEIIAYDASEDNPINHEYTLLSRSPGVTLSEIYFSLDDAQMTQILDQLIDFLLQLRAHPWKGIGGLVLNDKGEAELGQVVDETFWQAPDIENFWPQGETVASLNIQGPYETYVDYISAQIRQYILLIQKHNSLEFMRHMVPRLEAFVVALSQYAGELNNSPLVLAHRDMHFANLLFDTSSGNITAVLDWEFSGVVPYTVWNPRRAFLWNGRSDDNCFEEKKRLMDLFTRRCVERKVSLLEDANFVSSRQESMQKVATFLRAIVEVSPRGQKQDLVSSWKATVLENMAAFGV